MGLRCARVCVGFAILLLAGATPGLAYDLALRPGTQNVAEGARNARVTATLTGCAGSEFPASWTASAEPGPSPAAQEGIDFRKVQPNSFRIGGGTTTVTLTIPIVQDSAIEPNERFQLVLRPVQGAALVCSGGTQLPDRNEIRANIVIVDDDTPPPPPLASLQPVGALERQVVARTRVDLAVRAVRADGTAAPGTTVSWVLTGEATLVGGATSVADNAGVATKPVDIGSLAREIRVTASAPGVASVVFVLRTGLDLGTLFDPTLQPGPASVAETLDALCRNPQNQFAELCAGLTRLDPDGARRTIEELTPIEHASALPLGVEAARRQTREVWRRQAELHRRARKGESGRVSWNLPLPAQDPVASRSTVEPLGRQGWEAREVARAAGGEQAIQAALSRLLQPIALESGGVHAAQEPGAERPAAAAEIGAEESRWGAFVSGRTTTGDREPTSGQPGLDYDAVGVTAGLDVRASANVFLGIAGGYDDSGGDFASDGGDLSIRGTSATAYLSAMNGGFYFDLSAGAGRDDYQLSRRLVVPAPGGGTSTFTGSGEPGGERWTAGLAMGYDFGRDAATLSVFARGNWVDASVDAFVESPTVAGARLEILEQDLQSLLAEAGFEWTYAASFEWGVLQPLLSVSALRELEDDPRELRGRFVGDPAGTIFTVPTDAVDESYFTAAAGLTATLARGCGLFVLVEEEFDRDDLSALTASAGLHFEF